MLQCELSENLEKLELSKRFRTQDHVREWMGIEPTRDRVNDPSTALKAVGPTRRPDTPRCEAYLNRWGGGFQALRLQVGNPSHT